MNNIIINTLTLVIGTIGGISFIIFILKGKETINIEKKQEKAKELINESTEKAKELLEETNLYAEKIKNNSKENIERRQKRIKNLEESLKNRELNIFKREERNNTIKLKIASEKKETQSIKEETQRGEKKVLDKLCEKTGSILINLKDEIINKYKKELELKFTEKIVNFEENLKENALKKAKKIVINVMQRLCSATSVETRSVLIKVPKDHIKGKIVGKEGVNIKEFEKNLDVDVIFNDLPNTISVSSFNLVNRRIAEIAIKKLIKIKGDINPFIVKKTIKESEKETDEELYKIGKKAVEKLGLKIKQDKELLRIIGRLQYRTSYGQNIMKHSMEVSWIATMLGSELGLNVEICKTAGFLHDLGKAIDQDPNVQGGHDYLTKELMEKFNFPKEEVHAAWVHHYAAQPETTEALIIIAADAISACRPGARQESIERYVERLKALEETAKSFNGVKNTYAISAGRELRIIVDPEKIEDKQMQELANKVAHKIEDNLAYPGTIKVNVIRKTQHVELAK